MVDDAVVRELAIHYLANVEEMRMRVRQVS